jgi:CRISPR-associated protein Csd1
MILQALTQYYARLRDDPQVNVPRPGFSRQGVHFCLTLDSKGRLVGDPLDLRKDNTPKNLIVPQAVKRSSGIFPNFLWDNTGYALGADAKGQPERTREAFSAFKSLHHTIGDSFEDIGMQALLSFLDAWDPQKVTDLPLWEEMCGLNLVFKLDGDLTFLHDRPAIQEAWLSTRRHKYTNVLFVAIII